MNLPLLKSLMKIPKNILQFRKDKQNIFNTIKKMVYFLLKCIKAILKLTTKEKFKLYLITLLNLVDMLPYYR